MTRLLSTIATLVILAGGCGDSRTPNPGPSCIEVCDNQTMCGTAIPDCETACAEARSFLDPAYSNQISVCASTTCSSVEECTTSTAATAPDGRVTMFLSDVCSWALPCAPPDMMITQTQCVQMFQDIGDPGEPSPWEYVKLVRQSLLDCMTNCFQTQSCADIDSALSTCAGSCGFPIGDEDTSTGSGTTPVPMP